MQDGVAESFTAGMIEPYLDCCGCQTANRGPVPRRPGGAARVRDPRWTRTGFQVHLHAIGDRAVREALDAIEAARAANGANDHRHHIAHLQVMHPDDVPRFAALGVTANMQALWAAHEPQMDELTIPFIGPERAARQYLFGDLLRSGARLAAGSDWAVSSANPLRGDPRRGEPDRCRAPAAAEPFLPGQSLSLAEALAAYTAGSAYVNHLDETGADRARQARRPGRARPRPVRRPAGRDRQHRGRRSPTSAASGSMRRRRQLPPRAGSAGSRRAMESRMESVPLGSGGPQVSRVGLGLMGMSGIYGPADEAESIATIRAALDAGITLLDTGDFYGMGHNEMLLRDALRGVDRGQRVHPGQVRRPARPARRVHRARRQPGRGQELAGLHAAAARHRLRRPVPAGPAGPARSDRGHGRRDRGDDRGRASSGTSACPRWAPPRSAARTPCTRSPRCRSSTR